jgi:hypothetical protein
MTISVNLTESPTNVSVSAGGGVSVSSVATTATQIIIGGLSSASLVTSVAGKTGDVQIDSNDISVDPIGFSIITDTGLNDALYQLDQAISSQNTSVKKFWWM